MVDREVDGPVWSCVALGASVCGPGPLLELMLAIFGCSWASTGGPGPLLGPMLAVLDRSWGLCDRKMKKNMAALKLCLSLQRECDLRPPERSWAALGAYVGGLGPLMGLFLPVLGRS